MWSTSQILVRRIALAFSAVSLLLGLAACGQTGSLYLPSEPAAANRATLPQTLGVGATAPKPTASSPVSP